MVKKFVSLNQNSDFKRLYKRGKSCVRKSLVLYAMRSRTGEARLGITAGKKVGGAVIRNRSKRRLRELYRTHLKQLKGGYDICLVARGLTATTDFSYLEQDFIAACQRVGIWNDEEVTD